MNHDLPQSKAGETRRTFIKKAATAAAAVVASSQLMRSSSFAAAPGVAANSGAAPVAEGDHLAIGIIGVGSQGLAHLRSIMGHGNESNSSVVAVCDLWSKRREAARQQANLNENRAFEDYQDMLALEEIDAIVVATADQWHARIAIDAMNAGKHVYLEKPMTRYLGEAFEVYDTAKRTGRTLQIGTQGCAEPSWTKSAEIIRNGGIGPLVLAQASYMRNAGDMGEWNYAIDKDLTPETLNWEKWLGPVPSREFSADHFFRWRKYHPYCAGIIGDLMPHQVAPMLLGTGTTEFPRRVVSLGTRAISTDRDVNDNIQLLAEFPSGLTIQVIGSTVNEQGLTKKIRGHHATLTMGATDVNLAPERPFADEIDPESFQLPNPGNTISALEKNWISCIRTGEEPLAGPELSIRLQTVLSLAEMSERLNIMCLFDEKTRQVTTGDGRVVSPITYGSTIPV